MSNLENCTSGADLQAALSKQANKTAGKGDQEVWNKQKL